MPLFDSYVRKTDDSKPPSPPVSSIPRAYFTGNFGCPSVSLTHTPSPPVSFGRHKVTNNLSRSASLHGTPTVASSNLTASTSANDLSQPYQKSDQSHMENIFRGGLESRLPSSLKAYRYTNAQESPYPQLADAIDNRRGPRGLTSKDPQKGFLGFRRSAIPSEADICAKQSRLPSVKNQNSSSSFRNAFRKDSSATKKKSTLDEVNESSTSWSHGTHESSNTVRQPDHEVKSRNLSWDDECSNSNKLSAEHQIRHGGSFFKFYNGLGKNQNLGEKKECSRKVKNGNASWSHMDSDSGFLPPVFQQMHKKCERWEESTILQKGNFSLLNPSNKDLAPSARKDSLNDNSARSCDGGCSGLSKTESKVEGEIKELTPASFRGQRSVYELRYSSKDPHNAQNSLTQDTVISTEHILPASIKSIGSILNLKRGYAQVPTSDCHPDVNVKKLDSDISSLIDNSLPIVDSVHTQGRAASQFRGMLGSQFNSEAQSPKSGQTVSSSVALYGSDSLSMGKLGVFGFVKTLVAQPNHSRSMESFGPSSPSSVVTFEPNSPGLMNDSDMREAPAAGPTTFRSPRKRARSTVTLNECDSACEGVDFIVHTSRSDQEKGEELPDICKTPSAQARFFGTPKNRAVNTLVVSSQQKENQHPRTRPLLGPISHSRAQQKSRIPKSLTSSGLPSLPYSLSATSLRLSNINPQTQISTDHLRTEPTTFLSTPSNSPPLPVFTTNTRQINTAQTDAFWCGRFTALHDRFHSEILDTLHYDSKTYQRFQDGTKSPTRETLWQVEQSEPTAGLQYMKDADTRSSKRAFIHLGALCVTDDAKKSLWHFQLAFARINKNKQLLPSGGKMSTSADKRKSKRDKEASETRRYRNTWAARMTRAIGGTTHAPACRPNERTAAISRV